MSNNNSSSLQTQEIESNEFLSALAAGMSAKVIVEVASDFSSSTIALAAAARQTRGKVFCILPEPKLDESQRVIEETGLKNMVEFKTGEPVDVLHHIGMIDFSLIDCKSDHYHKLLETLNVNPTRSVIVANNLVEGRKGLGGHLKRVENQSRVTSMKHPIGKGMEITMIGKKFGEGSKRSELRGSGGGVGGRYTGIDWRRRRSTGGVSSRDYKKTKWVVEIDEKSGEEHIFRLPKCTP
ncbi:hypothetical protein Leryth_016010 [Lithospermum erythrorhizon]|uniref:S-adenosyl-L-methionine-dependent methyltransferase n=1 Tax=Lithospermum erythrorhizon TaxID=34254 RepID=A0AAV3NIX9_LITER|nr:hypothetical protein Leryth_016010 [Lithospermum erythrorhizon]